MYEEVTFHPRNAKNVGYIVTLDDVVCYVAGDADAAELVNEIDPKLAIPTHYGSVVGTLDAGKKFADLVNTGIEVRVMI